jgi:hypothetical protein
MLGEQARGAEGADELHLEAGAGRGAPEGPPVVRVVDDPHVRAMVAWALEGEGLPLRAAADQRRVAAGPGGHG